MGKKKNNSHCLYGCMCSFLVLVSLVILISLYKDYKYRQIYNKIDPAQRRNYHKSAYKTMLSQSPAVKQGGFSKTEEPVVLRPQFYSSSEAILESIRVNLTKFGGPVQGQVRAMPLRRNDNDDAGTTASATKVVSFLGIPYAQSPVGIRQFEPAKLSLAWRALLDASRAPHKCPQGAHFFSAISDMNSVDEAESEDCLYLNIWTPYSAFAGQNQSRATGSRSKKPVLVYFHSGLFSFGTISSHDFDPSNLVAGQEIVVVTVQYRLGALGFASFQKGHTSLALSDQVKALEWLHANVQHFGGDPRQITLAGHGAGAMAVGAHLMNPVTNQLFRRVILQGYQNLINIGIYGMNERASRTLSEELGCAAEVQAPNNTLAALKKCAQKSKIKPSSIVEYQHFMFEKHSVPFGPEFGPLTADLVGRLGDENATLLFKDERKPTVTELIQLFQNWNLFPRHIQFLIGLNSDDDYKLESTNRRNVGVHFDEEEEEEEEEKPAEESSDSGVGVTEHSKPTNSNANTNANIRNANKQPNNNRLSKQQQPESKAELRQGEPADEETDKEEDDVEEEEGDGEDQEQASAVKDNDQEDKKSIPSDETTTIPPNEVSGETEAIGEDEITTIPPGRLRRSLRLDRYRRSATDKTAAAVHLEADEIVKLCKLTEFYRLLRRKDAESVSDHVTLYRIDPRVLQNPLEEVSLAFGARQKKWLKNFDGHVVDLWASFIKSGRSLPGEPGNSQLARLELDSVRFINLGQREAVAEAQVGGQSTEMHDSSYGWNTFTDLKSHCQSI